MLCSRATVKQQLVFIHFVPHNFVDRIAGTSIYCAFEKNGLTSLDVITPLTVAG